jgi:predicted CxxxxCH...CXXCH cytochrome family protein
VKWALMIWALGFGTACSDPRVLSGPCTTDCTADVHAPGILDPTSPNFHPLVLERLNWSFPLCASCHGSDFSGGVSGVSCLGCHRDGPTACATCHGTGPTSFAHTIHASPRVMFGPIAGPVVGGLPGGGGVTCGECHIVPASWDDDGHIVHDGVAITTPPQITFGARAGLTIAPADRHGAPSWDGTTCRNIYCHGDALPIAAGGIATTPRWDDPVPTATCTACHGDPPPSHLRSDCGSCHPRTAPHMDGIVQIGTGCDGCHGSPSSPAPPVDLEGNLFTTAIGVGAHQAHLQGASRISAPVPCATCHLVPASVDSPGHIDSLPPAEVTQGLGWDHNAQTCATSYCHGTARPVWTSSGQVVCGSCHGIPPASAPHTPAMTLTTCASCHPGTVDAFGSIIVTDGKSEHINGRVDLR